MAQLKEYSAEEILGFAERHMRKIWIVCAGNLTSVGTVKAEDRGGAALGLTFTSEEALQSVTEATFETAPFKDEIRGMPVVKKVHRGGPILPFAKL